MIENRKMIPITNRYAFADVLRGDLELARDFISVLIGKKIGKVKLAQRESAFDISPLTKGVRFDVYLKDDNEESFDVELQVSNEEDLEKRIRYYHSIMTADSLLKGEEYRNLKDSYVIFIFVKHDPFKLGKTMYEIGSTVLNADNRRINDGMHTYVFNFTKNREKNGDSKIEEIAEYFYNGNVGGVMSGRMDLKIQDLNEKPTWREKIMTLEQELKIARNRGYDEGHRKGLEEGREKGLAEGKNVGAENSKKEIAVKLLQMGIPTETVSEATGLSTEILKSLLH